MIKLKYRQPINAELYLNKLLTILKFIHQRIEHAF